MFTCVRCGGSLREGAKFCAKCGNRVVAPQVEVQVTKNEVVAPAQTSQQTAIRNVGFAEQESKPIVAEHRADASITTPYPPLPLQATRYTDLPSIVPQAAAAHSVPAPSVPSDVLAQETSEVASWRWNWGVFLVPGLWLMAHRIKPKVVPLVLMGVPMVICFITTITSILAARAAEQLSVSGGTSTYGNTPYDLWNSAVYPIGCLLALYIFSCLLSIRTARVASADAWNNFSHQSLASFRTAQRIWAVGGLLLCCLLFTINAYVWSHYNFWDAKRWQNLAPQSKVIVPVSFSKLSFIASCASSQAVAACKSDASDGIFYQAESEVLG